MDLEPFLCILAMSPHRGPHTGPVRQTIGIASSGFDMTHSLSGVTMAGTLRLRLPPIVISLPFLGIRLIEK
jgi:hypothetical protein